MTINEQQFYDMLNVDEHMNFTNRIQELVFDKKGREEFYSKILNIHHDMGVDFFRDYFMAHSAVSANPTSACAQTDQGPQSVHPE